jgi:flagellar biosynthesis GTPase FlhF
MRDAVKAVRAEFGPDAVILNTKEKQSTEAGGRVFEVTAAIAGKSGAQRTSSLDFGSEGQDLLFFKKKLDVLERKIELLLEEMPKRKHFNVLDSGIEDLKEILFDVLRKEGRLELGDRSDPIGRILHQLKLMEVDHSVILEISNHLKELKPGLNRQEELQEFYQNEAVKRFMGRVKISPPFGVNSSGYGIHILTGPNGVGKTSAVIKLAQTLLKKDKQKVAVVSFDKTRIAASEQLRVYSKVLGFSFSELEEPSNLTEVLGQIPEDTVVLVDTFGVSPKNQKELKPILELKKNKMPIDFHIVLSTNANLY